MKKVGIMTLCGNNNYGNKLQNYALIQALSSINYQATTIWIENTYKGKNINKIKISIRNKIDEYTKYYKRRKYFLNFNKYLNIKEYLIFDNDFRKIKDKYDCFLVGSDQVWNYNYFNNDSLYFLTESNKRNIAYSASFGVNNIPTIYQKRYQEGLKNFDFISVREDKGKSIIESLTNNRDVQVLIDPTMLLTCDEWDIIAKKPKQLKAKKYILNYFLGELSNERKKEIERIAKENECEIINILDSTEPLYYSGPAEFIYLEKNAFLICTDSFHSSVFAILYNRPFIVFEREEKNGIEMYSRIDTLINKFQIENRKYLGKITEKNLKHDYSNAYRILEQERKKSFDFLKNALE